MRALRRHQIIASLAGSLLVLILVGIIEGWFVPAQDTPPKRTAGPAHRAPDRTVPSHSSSKRDARWATLSGCLESKRAIRVGAVTRGYLKIVAADGSHAVGRISYDGTAARAAAAAQRKQPRIGTNTGVTRDFAIGNVDYAFTMGAAASEITDVIVCLERVYGQST